MELSSTAAALLAGAALVAALVAAVLAAAALSGQRRVLRAHRVAFRGRQEDMVTLLADAARDLSGLRREVELQHAEVDGLRQAVSRGICRVGTVHYDAFPGMGGRLSFSAALLDEHGDGLVLTSISGRAEARTYLKPVAGGVPVLAGAGTRELSEEEREAVERARHGPSAVADAS